MWALIATLLNTPTLCPSTLTHLQFSSIELDMKGPFCSILISSQISFSASIFIHPVRHKVILREGLI